MMRPEHLQDEIWNLSLEIALRRKSAIRADGKYTWSMLEYVESYMCTRIKTENGAVWRQRGGSYPQPCSLESEDGEQ